MGERTNRLNLVMITIFELWDEMRRKSKHRYFYVAFKMTWKLQPDERCNFEILQFMNDIFQLLFERIIFSTSTKFVFRN